MRPMENGLDIPYLKGNEEAIGGSTTPPSMPICFEEVGRSRGGRAGLVAPAATEFGTSGSSFYFRKSEDPCE